MYIMCDGCGRLIAEQDAGYVTVKHRGRTVRVEAGEIVCACGAVTAVRDGVPVAQAGEPYVRVEFAGALA